MDAGYVEAVSVRCAEVVREPLADLPDLGIELRDFLAPAWDLTAGGKRGRARLCAAGWRAVGATGPHDPVVGAGCALELFQAAALVHDDIIDDAATRRGLPASHVRFASLHPGGPTDPVRFGANAAILLGDLLLVLAGREMRRAAGLVPAHAAGALEIWELMTAEVAVGQYLDIWASTRPLIEESLGVALERALTVVRHKSARYSVEHPLVLGAALGGGSPEELAALRRIGTPLGEAFQLRDDELGVFGDPGVTGKPAGDDLREGKRTPLIIVGLALAAPADAGFIRGRLGDPRLDDHEVDRIRRILVASGALDRHEDLIAERVLATSAAIDAAPLDEAVRTELRALADTLTRRRA
ncbi:MAG: polyprenyl synthetase family protein [Actinobacteria bacterium]|nr:polyprenyl synthetase family protein [Actinomycetota bacterium]